MMNPSVAVLLYPGCIFFEIALAVEVLSQSCCVRYYTPDGEPHTASNSATIAVSGGYDDIARLKPAAVLVPGGNPDAILIPENLVAPALRDAARQGAFIAGICAGNLAIAASGLLLGKRGTHNYTAEFAPYESVCATAHFWQGMEYVRANVVVDQKIITAQPWAYREFAATVGESLGVLSADAAQALVAYTARSAIYQK